MEDLELIKIQKENHEILNDIKKDTNYIANYIWWRKIWGTIKLLIILAMILGSVLYLPIILKISIKKLQEVINIPLNIENIRFNPAQKNTK